MDRRDSSSPPKLHASVCEGWDSCAQRYIRSILIPNASPTLPQRFSHFCVPTLSFIFVLLFLSIIFSLPYYFILSLPYTLIFFYISRSFFHTFLRPRQYVSRPPQVFHNKNYLIMRIILGTVYELYGASVTICNWSLNHSSLPPCPDYIEPLD